MILLLHRFGLGVKQWLNTTVPCRFTILYYIVSHTVSD